MRTLILEEDSCFYYIKLVCKEIGDMSTEIRYVVDPRLRLEVANRISLDF